MMEAYLVPCSAWWGYVGGGPKTFPKKLPAILEALRKCRCHQRNDRWGNCSRPAFAAPQESGFDVVDGCAGRPAKGRRWKSVAVKE